MALAGVRGTAAVASCFGKTLYIIPIETPHFIRLSGIIPSVNHFSTKFLPLNTAKIHALCMVYIMMSKTEEKFVNFVTHKCFC